MVLTIDGLSSAGKTTQGVILSKRFGLQHVSIDGVQPLFVKIEHLCLGSNCDDAFIQILRNLFMTRSLARGWENDVVVVDKFWASFLAFWKNRQEDMKSALDFFRQGLLMHDGKEPDFSFYLYVDAENLAIRNAHRYQNQEIVDLRVEVKDDVEVVAFSEFANYLKVHIPYFHIIDGNQYVLPSEIWATL